ncbi:right-handed parallel beta-helix repeat-containing protein [Lewinella sp. 4G2]|uniref:right-handed parallel beta-helix repeat-containing protein n=1 Tax=Lewinella sp. 4G2 TaxID=1803372 RepID=UPI0007B4B697|nr:right-handed parallel beta-helix repeat-containing protein [Lewinella sp. 4G2]
MHLLARLLALVLFGTVLFLSSCDTETEFLTGDEVELRFSTDTLTFDTVFTDRGSATRIMQVYNDADDPVKIDRISVEGNEGVTYRFNVDGFSGPVAEEVIIWGGDSIFVFVEVFVDPTAPTAVSPFIAEDRLVFLTGNSRSDVELIAFGQNAFYINEFRRGRLGVLNCDAGEITLPNDLPVVIYGSLAVDDCKLIVQAGTEIYVHGGVQRDTDEIFTRNGGFFNDGLILVTETASIEMRGTADNPISVSTDRLEPEFRTDPAKYQGLIIRPGSRGNIIRHTSLLNSITGVLLDSLSEVLIENTTIAYTGGPAISAYQSDVTVRNTLIHSNFNNAVQFVKGGSLTMDHVTIANYGVDASALVLTNFTCDEETDLCIAAPMVTRIRNSIIAGSRESEMRLLDIFEGGELGAFDIEVANTVLRTGDDFLRSQDGLFANFYDVLCENCVNTVFDDALFLNIGQDDYRLDSLSVARNLGAFLPALPVDLEGVEREPGGTDAGALQFVPEG